MVHPVIANEGFKTTEKPFVQNGAEGSNRNVYLVKCLGSLYALLHYFYICQLTKIGLIMRLRLLPNSLFLFAGMRKDDEFKQFFRF